jgi:hypothetical protein
MVPNSLKRTLCLLVFLLAASPVIRPWGVVLDCRAFRAYCAQYGTYIQETGYGSKGVLVGSEDCLYLNIWRPRSPQAGLPVYVFIHGGANIAGRSDLTFYQGTRFGYSPWKCERERQELLSWNSLPYIFLSLAGSDQMRSVSS